MTVSSNRYMIPITFYTKLLKFNYIKTVSIHFSKHHLFETYNIGIKF